MSVIQCWAIVRSDGAGFVGLSSGLPRFVLNESEWRCYQQRYIAVALIKRHRMADCEPKEVERPDPLPRTST